MVILDTVKAACNIDYPESKFRVILSDDAADAGLKASLISLTKEHPNLLYYSRAREKGVRRGFKAGNIHSAMSYAASLGPAEWCCVVDADVIPSKDLLRALLAHCANDKDAAMAVLPQVTKRSILLLCIPQMVNVERSAFTTSQTMIPYRKIKPLKPTTTRSYGMR